MLEPNVSSSFYIPLFLSQTVVPKFPHHNSSLVNIKYTRIKHKECFDSK